MLSSEISLVSGEMSQTNQCTHIPMGASGSSTIKAKLFVPSGTSLQARCGETSVPSQVNLVGTFPSCSKSLLSNFKKPPHGFSIK